MYGFLNILSAVAIYIHRDICTELPQDRGDAHQEWSMELETELDFDILVCPDYAICIGLNCPV